MTKTELTGEARHAARRRRFWLMIAGFIGMGGIIGFVLGFTEGVSGLDIVGSPIFWVLAVIVGNLGFVLLSVWFYRQVDELEIADNLWGSMIAFYVYVAALPSWWVLHEAGVAPPVNHWAIYIAVAFTAFGVYGARKVINR